MKKDEIFAVIGTSLGMIGALLIIIIYLRIKETKIFYRKLIFILSVYDFLQSVIFLLPGHKHKTVCRIQFELISGFCTTCQFWSALISLLSYLKVVKQFTDERSDKIQKKFHVFMWITVIGFVVSALFLENPTDSTTYWCWTKNKAFVAVFYSFIWFYLLVCLIFYIFILIRLRQIIKNILRKYQTTKVKQMNQVWIEFRMSFIPLIYILVIIPATIRRIRNLINPSTPDIEVINILQGLLSSSQGFWDFWIFVVFDQEIRKKLRNSFSKFSQENSNLDKVMFKNSFQEKAAFFGKDLIDQQESGRPLMDFTNKDIESN
ncbi:g protein-coupled receptor [Anaeramoeba ignava]|uniref:G protein-coupled receptor n=1 Tax=Anaeramoeba ignava TaxID=1746090 RepID=A0A9Q0LW88_ANAIG|nr:g protein-coupled receptor [Anaeramoeba ignava]